VRHWSDVSRLTLRGLLCLLLLAAGCGYHPLGAGSLPPEMHHLYVAPLTNGTFRPGLQGLVGAAILRRLRQDSRIHLVNQEVADAVLAGDLTTYENLPIAFDSSDVGRRFRVRVTFAMQLKERNGEKMLLKEEISGEAFYTTGSDVVGTRSAEDEAAQRAAQELAARVMMRLIEGL
jgi:outer membrane lipopolysaccharide assembly protein LptE/RlpB